MQHTDQSNPVLASGGTPEPHRLSAMAQCAPHRVLPQDHPVRLLAWAMEDAGLLGGDSGLKCKLIRVITASSKAHIKKTRLHHASALSELQFLALDDPGAGPIPENVLAIYRDAVLFHKARSSGKESQTTPGPKGEKTPRPKAGKDELALALQGLTLDEVYAIAAPALGSSEEELRTKYGHLNPGMQRMNLGNRMRSKGVKL